MKKEKRLLMILILFFAFFITTPKVNAEMIKIYDEEITEIKEELEGRIYKYGTPINLGNLEYTVNYRDINNIASYTNTSSNASIPKYIGYNTNERDLKNYSMYWEIYRVNASSSVFELNLTPAITNFNICDITDLSIGDTCTTRSISSVDRWVEIKYQDKDGQDLGSEIADPYENLYPYIGYINDELAKENVKVWKLKSIDSYGGSYLGVTFEETEEQSNDKVDFTLTCDKDKINYKEKTICHLNAKNYMITGDTISIALNEKDDLELLRLIPTEYFSVENDNNIIKINPKYISTERGDFELLSFEVQARYETNEIDNISISNISYYNGETYTNLKTTINIENRTFLTSNPLTANPTLFKILLVSAFLIACTTLVLKRESV